MVTHEVEVGMVASHSCILILELMVKEEIYRELPGQ